MLGTFGEHRIPHCSGADDRTQTARTGLADAEQCNDVGGIDMVIELSLAAVPTALRGAGAVIAEAHALIEDRGKKLTAAVLGQRLSHALADRTIEPRRSPLAQLINRKTRCPGNPRRADRSHDGFQPIIEPLRRGPRQVLALNGRVALIGKRFRSRAHQIRPHRLAQLETPAGPSGQVVALPARVVMKRFAQRCSP